MGGEAKTKCDKLRPIGGVINETKHQTKQKNYNTKNCHRGKTAKYRLKKLQAKIFEGKLKELKNFL